MAMIIACCAPVKISFVLNVKPSSSLVDRALYFKLQKSRVYRTVHIADTDKKILAAGEEITLITQI